MIYPIIMAVLPSIYHLWIRKISGLENIPRNEPFIIAANHSSYYDTILPYTLLIPFLNKQVHALVNSMYWDYFFSRIIINHGQCIPVYVEKNTKSKKLNELSLKKAANYLKKGDIIQMFPEGKRSYDGNLGKAYTGIAKLAITTNSKVVPFGIIGSDKVFPKGKFFPRFKRCEIKIGKPIHFNKYYKKRNDKKTLNEVTRKIMVQIAKLVGQGYKY
jgi:1-acyl-sn-glycerol-3-phosphate acyltransferase